MHYIYSPCIIHHLFISGVNANYRGTFVRDRTTEIAVETRPFKRSQSPCIIEYYARIEQASRYTLHTNVATRHSADTRAIYRSLRPHYADVALARFWQFIWTRLCGRDFCNRHILHAMQAARCCSTRIFKLCFCMSIPRGKLPSHCSRSFIVRSSGQLTRLAFGALSLAWYS